MAAILQWKQNHSLMQDCYHEDSESKFDVPIFAGAKPYGCHYRS